MEKDREKDQCFFVSSFKINQPLNEPNEQCYEMLFIIIIIYLCFAYINVTVPYKRTAFF